MERLEEEDISKVLVTDMPQQSEYQEIIYKSRESQRYLDTDYNKFNKLNSEVWTDLYMLMARCIARGIRLDKVEGGVQ